MWITQPVKVSHVRPLKPAYALTSNLPCLDSSISITIKSLKPALTIPLTVQITDTISDLKSLIAKSSNNAPSAETQRLLLKGKALTDTKLIKEYDIAEGSTVHLMIKPSNTATATPPTEIAMPEPFKPDPALISQPLPKASSPTGSRPSTYTHHHSRTRSWSNVPPPEPPSPTPPSLTITTSLNDPARPSQSHEVTDADIDVPPKGPQAQVTSAAFHKTISDPEFWQRVHALCVGEFAFEDDADQTWEGFLLSMKGRLSAGEAAKIRDVVGVRGKCTAR
jgi:hypothetical protein